MNLGTVKEVDCAAVDVDRQPGGMAVALAEVCGHFEVVSVAMIIRDALLDIGIGNGVASLCKTTLAEGNGASSMQRSGVEYRLQVVSFG